MLDHNVFYKILAITMGTIWLIYFLFGFAFPKLKPYRRAVAMVVLGVGVGFRLLFTNTVIEINDDNDIRSMLLVVPYNYQLQNDDYVLLKPQLGFTKWIINNGEQKAYRESINYGDYLSAPLTQELIHPYSMKMIETIDYFFEPPPSEIKTLSSSDSRGWLHR